MEDPLKGINIGWVHWPQPGAVGGEHLPGRGLLPQMVMGLHPDVPLGIASGAQERGRRARGRTGVIGRKLISSTAVSKSEGDEPEEVGLVLGAGTQSRHQSE